MRIPSTVAPTGEIERKLGPGALLEEVIDLLRDAAEKDETTYWPRMWLARALRAVADLFELRDGAGIGRK